MLGVVALLKIRYCHSPGSGLTRGTSASRGGGATEFETKDRHGPELPMRYGKTVF